MQLNCIDLIFIPVVLIRMVPMVLMEPVLPMEDLSTDFHHQVLQMVLGTINRRRMNGISDQAIINVFNPFCIILTSFIYLILLDTSKVPKPPVGYKVLKNFYREDLVTADRSHSEFNRFYHENEITVNGSNVPNPVFDFSECGFPDKITDGIRMLGYQKPTPIQAVSWPIALSGRDLVGIAQTGSGKTLSYILPAFIHIEGQPERKG